MGNDREGKQGTSEDKLYIKGHFKANFSGVYLMLTCVLVLLLTHAVLMFLIRDIIQK